MGAVAMGMVARNNWIVGMPQARLSTWRAGLRTTALLATLTGLLVLAGELIGGPGMALAFLGIGLVGNMAMYWFSDKIALRMSHARPLSEDEAPRLHQITRELAHSAGIPVPRLYMVPASQPNAFACGRGPQHAAVAVTEGITRMLSESQLRGVIAHELSHIRNRDTLTQAVAATIGGAITWIAYMLVWFGDDDGAAGLFGQLALLLLAPLAATIIQLAISRQREYAADATGALISGSPNALADALERLEAGAKAVPMQVNASAELLYIVKPSSRRGLASLFSTHPPIEERVSRLRALAAG